MHEVEGEDGYQIPISYLAEKTGYSEVFVHPDVLAQHEQGYVISGRPHVYINLKKEDNTSPKGNRTHSVNHRD